jgi:hypothetical protein
LRCLFSSIDRTITVDQVAYNYVLSLTWTPPFSTYQTPIMAGKTD